MLSSADLLSALRAARERGTLTNAEIQALLKLPSSRVAEIFEGKRAIKIDEMKLLVERYNLGEGEGPHAVNPPVAVHEVDMVGITHADLDLGMGAVFVDHHVEAEILQFPRKWIETITYSPAELLTWARGRGDSMFPTISDGDLVLLDRSQTTVREQDAIWAFTVGDVGSIKRLRVKGDRYIILSDNPSVPADEEPQDFVRIVGRVVFVGAKK